MSYDAYIRELEQELKRLPRQEREEAIAYYHEYFDDAGPDREEEVLRELGSPKEAAAEIVKSAAMKRLERPEHAAKKGISTVWVVILAVCAVPVGLPLALAGLVLILAAVVCVLAVGLSFGFAGIMSLVSGIACMVAGFVFLPSFPPDGLAVLGTGMVSLGAGILFLLLTIFLFRGGTKIMVTCMRHLLTRGTKNEKEMA